MKPRRFCQVAKNDVYEKCEIPIAIRSDPEMQVRSNNMSFFVMILEQVNGPIHSLEA